MSATPTMSLYLPFKKRLFFLFLFSFSMIQLYAQKTEVGVTGGSAYYWGDVNNIVQVKDVRLGASAFVRYHYSPRWVFRGNFAYARLTGADSVSRGSTWQVHRNLSFWTDIFELSGVAEFNLIPDENGGRKLVNRGIPYVYGGLGVFHFNPKSTNPITGKEVELQPLDLNGVHYSRVALCIPLGLGYRYYLNRRWQIGVELSMRYSLSSYVDDVGGKSIYPKLETLKSDDARIMWSPSKNRINDIIATGSTYIGGPEGKPRGKNEWVSDVYIMAGVTVSYRIWPGQNLRCPRIY